MDVVFGLAASVSYGAADFLGGLGARRTRAMTLVLLSQAVGLVLLLASVPILESAPLTAHAMLWGAASGIGGSLGLVALYRGLARGRMSIVAPIGAVIGATVPVIFGMATGESVGGLARIGVPVALLSLLFVPASPGPPATNGGHPATGAGPTNRGLIDAVLAGLGVAAFLIFFARAGEDPGMWPLVAARVASVLVLGSIALLSGAVRRTLLAPTWFVLPVGLLDTFANLLYLYASRVGLLSIVALLTCLYPATTIVLARVVLKERLAPLQSIGLAMAAVGVVLIAAG